MRMPLSGLVARAAAIAVAGIVPWGCASAAEVPPPAARAEIQINLCAEPAQIIDALHLQPKGASPRRAWYFDTRNLDLYRQGLVFRLRRTDKATELTLKVADQDCGRVAPDLVPAGQGKCEYDLHGRDMKGAVSLSRSLDDPTVERLLAGDRSLAEVLGPGQVRYLRDVLSVWPLSEGIERFGPVRIQPYRARGQHFVVEMWELPGGERYTEISRKAKAADALRLRADLEDTLARAGIAECPDQSSQAGAKLRAMAAGRKAE